MMAIATKVEPTLPDRYRLSAMACGRLRALRIPLSPPRRYTGERRPSGRFCSSSQNHSPVLHDDTQTHRCRRGQPLRRMKVHGLILCEHDRERRRIGCLQIRRPRSVRPLWSRSVTFAENRLMAGTGRGRVETRFRPWDEVAVLSSELNIANSRCRTVEHSRRNKAPRGLAGNQLQGLHRPRNSGYRHDPLHIVGQYLKAHLRAHSPEGKRLGWASCSFASA